MYLLCFHLKSDHLNTFIVMIRVWQLRVFFLLFLLVWFGELNKLTHIYAYAWVIENKLITVSFDLLSNYLIELNFFCLQRLINYLITMYFSFQLYCLLWNAPLKKHHHMYSTMERVYSLIKGFMRLFSSEGSMATIIQCHRTVYNTIHLHLVLKIEVYFLS